MNNAIQTAADVSSGTGHRFNGKRYQTVNGAAVYRSANFNTGQPVNSFG